MTFHSLTSRICLPLFSEAFTCRCIWRQFTTSTTLYAGENKDYVVNPDFVNRNPRNLEHMGFAWKREGWAFQSPCKQYYNKLILERSNWHTAAKVEHWTGVTVVSASTKELAIKNQLHSTTDVSASENIGRVIAQRCLKAGINNVFYDKNSSDFSSGKVQAFLDAVMEGCVNLEERTVNKGKYRPGVDYDNPQRVGGEDKDQPMKDDYQF